MGYVQGASKFSIGWGMSRAARLQADLIARSKAAKLPSKEEAA
jgi:hypothetical protein